MKHKVSVYVNCPYYRCEDKEMIFCENLVDGTNLRLHFNTPPDRKCHENIYCKGDYHRCFLLKALDQKYNYERARVAKY